MKVLDKIILCIFSVLILLMSILTCAFIFGWVEVTTCFVMFTNMLKDTTICNVLLGINVVFIILAIKGIFFESSDKEEKYNKRYTCKYSKFSC